MAEPTRVEAWDLVCEWIESDSLRKHVLGVEAAMRAYAQRDGADEEKWAVTGLVHDLDYERYPDPDTGHPRYALKELEARDYPPDVIGAVAGHAEYLGVPRGDPPGEDALRGGRALRLHRRLFARPPHGPRGHEAEVGAEEAQAAVLRGEGGPRADRPRNRGARRRRGRAHPADHRRDGPKRCRARVGRSAVGRENRDWQGPREAAEGSALNRA